MTMIKLYKHIIHIDTIIKTSEDFFKKIYLSLYLKGLCVRGSWRSNRTATYWFPLLLPSAVWLSPSPDAAQPKARGPSSLLYHSFLYHILSPTGLVSKLVSKLTDFLSSPSYIIVQSPTQYIPITGHRDVSFPLSLEWHVCLSSSGNNCHAVHRSRFSSASIWLYHGILPCPILSDKPAYANGICNFRVFRMACLAGSKVNIQQELIFDNNEVKLIS